MKTTVEIRRPRWLTSRRLKRARPLVLLLALAVASPVLASDTFTDVPNSNVHHDDINLIRTAGITQGCNPPTNNLYCPADVVRRDQMASFLARTAGLGAHSPKVNADKLDGLDSTAFAPASQYEFVNANITVLATANEGIGIAFCPPGKRVLGGGHFSGSNPRVYVAWSHPSFGLSSDELDLWNVKLVEAIPNDAAWDFSVNAICGKKS